MGAIRLFKIIVRLSSLPYDVLILSFGLWRTILFSSFGEQLNFASFTIYRKKLSMYWEEASTHGTDVATTSKYWRTSPNVKVYRTMTLLKAISIIVRIYIPAHSTS